MKCPICKKGDLVFTRDSVISYNLEVKGGKPIVGQAIHTFEIAELESTCLYCADCGATSEKHHPDFNEEIEKIWLEI